MIGQIRKIAGCWVAAVGIILAGLSGGCQTAPKYADLTPETGNEFHLGDSITVSFMTAAGDLTALPPHTERIHEDGTIDLSLVGQITAVGKTAAQLQKEIRDLYVPHYFRDLSVVVQGEQRYFYVDGEVRTPGQKEYPGQMSIVKAISVSGGFTDFAKRMKVQLTHGGHTRSINVEKANKDSRYDAPVYPGDTILVLRKIL